ncbi:DUF6541 family protein [Microbacterium sp. A84]|uniref:DUF6541 family protein n=1 Tax=Microbacterium sp. A84 TaxID=3450715 RepID=UPI003F424135
MIFDWLTATPVILVAAVVVFVPGLLSLAAAGMRGLALVAFAPVMTTAVASLAAIALSLLGIDWSPWSFVVVVALVSGAAWLVGPALPLLGRQRRTVPTSNRWLLPTALVIGAVIGFWRIASYVSDPSAISQTNDAVFHLNALRFIQETGSASSLEINSFIGGTGFYPAGWHALASIIVLGTGASIPLAVNALAIVIAALVWPMGLTWFARAATGSTTIAAYTAVLSGALQLFPLLLLQWGVLYPNALSVALIPASVALVLKLPVWSDAERPWRSVLQGGLFVAIALSALVFAQPASVLIFGLLCMIWLSGWMMTQGTGPVVIRVASIVAGWVVLAAVWFIFSGSTGGSHWPPFRDKFEVWLDILFNGQLRIPFAWGVSVLMLIGVVVAIRRPRWRWFAIAWVAVSALYVLAATFGVSIVRDGILGAWYADPYRIAALAPIIVIPLAAVGFDAIIRAVTARIRRGTGITDPLETGFSAMGLTIITVLTVVLVIVRPVAMPDYVMDRFEPDSRYEEAAVSYLSIDERELLESLGDLVDEDARVIGNPSTGTGFGYMLSGIDVFPRTWSPPVTAQWQELAFGLRDIASDPSVCDALAAYASPEYVLDFGLGEEYSGRYEMPGMTNFEGQAGFELVTQIGDASLWRITACGY